MEEIRNKFVLLDTNILIYSSKYVDEFQGFYKLLNSYAVKSVLDHTVKFEFLKGARDKKQKDTYQNFLSLLFGKDLLELQVNNDTIEKAIDIAIVYGRKNIKVETGDYMVAAQMLKYEKNLFLATTNHKDFPRFLFDRVFIHTIEVGRLDEILNIGLYRFNRKGFEICLKKLNE